MSSPTTLAHTRGLGVANGATVMACLLRVVAHAALSAVAVAFHDLLTDATSAKDGSIQKIRESSSPKCPMCAAGADAEIVGIFLSGIADLFYPTNRKSVPLGPFGLRPAAPPLLRRVLCELGTRCVPTGRLQPDEQNVARTRYLRVLFSPPR